MWGVCCRPLEGRFSSRKPVWGCEICWDSAWDQQQKQGQTDMTAHKDSWVNSLQAGDVAREWAVWTIRKASRSSFGVLLISNAEKPFLLGQPWRLWVHPRCYVQVKEALSLLHLAHTASSLCSQPLRNWNATWQIQVCGKSLKEKLHHSSTHQILHLFEHEPK